MSPVVDTVAAATLEDCHVAAAVQFCTLLSENVKVAVNWTVWPIMSDELLPVTATERGLGVTVGPVVVVFDSPHEETVTTKNNAAKTGNALVATYRQPDILSAA